ncbi:transposase [Legionella septentrionalis]|uniref:transposase n=1 Tax=Legionella septentrionalis TaxID=2498109 RepID=UPI000F8C342A|nr:transposase [Legionella septentrionalis]RUQ96566.1 hypothetical protein ELY11_07820 [Legionella septentrionalis]
MKNKGGRPRKLTYEIKDAIVEGVKKGYTLKAACKYAGVSYASLANWKRLAKTKDADTILYQDLITDIDAAIRLLWRQHRQQGLSAFRPEDLKFKAFRKRNYQHKKEIEDQKILNLFERLVILEKRKYKPS